MTMKGVGDHLDAVRNREVNVGNIKFEPHPDICLLLGQYAQSDYTENVKAPFAPQLRWTYSV